MREELAHRVHTDAALEAKGIERGDEQADHPLATLGRLPHPGLWMDTPTLHGLRETVHTALGKTRLLGNASYALPTIVTSGAERSFPLPNLVEMLYQPRT